MMHHNRFTRATTAALATTFGLLGLASVATTAHADSFKTLSKYSYVKTTRAMYTGQHTYINGKKGRKLITPKGTILKITGTGASRNSDDTLKYTIGLSRGDLHYNVEKNIAEASGQIAFKASDFKGYKLKMPVRTKLLQSGTGYFGDSDTVHRYKPLFHVTLDGYVEYYSTARLKHYGIYNGIEMSKLYDLPNGGNTSYTGAYINRIKPTASVKLSTFKVKGNTTYLYYKTPINGLTEKKVSSRYYRLTIKKTTDTLTQSWQYGDEDFTNAWWARYSVGGHHYFDLIELERGD
jgi:hypothetical protein